jgi:hypothetical protein
MPTFAIIADNRVINIIVADDKATAEAVSFEGTIAVQCSPSDLVSDLWTYDGTNLVPPQNN